MALTRHRQAEKLTLKEKLRVEKAEAERGGPQDYHCESIKIGCLPTEELEGLIRDGLIRVPLRDQCEPLEQFLWRVHARDSHELAEAGMRARQLEAVDEHGGWIAVGTMSAGLGNSPELKDLLHYLTNVVSHFGSAHTRTQRGKLINPLLAGERGWHASWQSWWLRREQAD